MKYFFIVLIFLVLNAHSRTCGQVIQTTGKVDILKARNNTDADRYAQPIKAPYDLLCTDVIVTQSGSRAKIKFANGMITLGPNTRIAISKVVRNTANPSILNLSYGKIRTFFDSKVDQEQEKQQFRVKTSTAVIGVRGTDFYVKFDPNTELTRQATLKGQVEVAQLGTNQKVLVNTGEQVDVGDTQKISEKTATEEKIQESPQTPTLESKLVVKPISQDLVLDIRQTSALVKEEVPFTSAEAVKVLGEPEKWIPPADEIPGDLKEIENIF